LTRAILGRVSRGIAVTAGLGSFTYFAVGPPAFNAALQLFASPYPSDNDALAAVGLCVWLFVLVAGVAQLRAAPPTSMVVTGPGRRGRALVFLAAGIVIFCGGVTRHLTGLGTMCCGSVQQAEELAR